MSYINELIKIMHSEQYQVYIVSSQYVLAIIITTTTFECQIKTVILLFSLSKIYFK